MKKKEAEKKDNNVNRPTFRKRIGSVRVSVFENAAESGQVYSNISLIRRYRGSDGEWHDSNVLNGIGDALAAIEGLRKAIDFVSERESETNEIEE